MKTLTEEEKRTRKIRRQLAEMERRREITACALAAVYPHASMVEADALLDQLETLGARVVIA